VPTCPADTIFFIGNCMELHARAPATHDDALAMCANLGRRLPSNGELETLKRTADVPFLATFEWTDDLVDVGPALYSGVGFGLGGSGASLATNAWNFRCVAGLSFS
jgi:hypothetical protein